MQRESEKNIICYADYSRLNGMCQKTHIFKFIFTHTHTDTAGGMQHKQSSEINRPRLKMTAIGVLSGNGSFWGGGESRVWLVTDTSLVSASQRCVNTT